MKVKGAPREKLAEAEFFLGKLGESDGSSQVSRPDFGYYLSAFLAAAESVIELLKKTHNPGFGVVRDEWTAGMSDEERRLYRMMSSQRRGTVHLGGVDMESETQHVDAFRHGVRRAREAGRPFIFFGPGGHRGAATIDIQRQYLTVGGSRMVAVGACASYLDLLRRLLELSESAR